MEVDGPHVYTGLTMEEERTSPPPTTTISTIAVHSGATKLVIALLQSREWLELKVLEMEPELTCLGATATEASDLLRAHDRVLTQLESKQSPVEELLRQADQLIATQRPRAEVYAAMAESLGLAWKDVNAHLEDRRAILTLNLAYKREEERCMGRMEELELACEDLPLAMEVDTVKVQLANLHTLKRGMLEALMQALQQGKQLLERLREIASAGTLDSRPDNIRTSAEKAVSQVDHWLELLHDRRQYLEGAWQTRKSQLEHFLGLTLLASELLAVEQALTVKTETLASLDQLGDSAASANLLLEDLMRIVDEAKELQERTLKITKSTEKLVSSVHVSSEQAIAQAYNVLSRCADYLDALDHRKELIEKSVTFFEQSEIAFRALDVIQNRLIDSVSLSVQENCQITHELEEITEPVISKGYGIVDAVGRNTPGAEGVRRTVEELESRKLNLEGICNMQREDLFHTSQALNNFLEKYNEIYSWLVRHVEACLQGHQDMGSVLAMARDFLNLHTQLLNDLTVNETEVKSLLSLLPSFLDQVTQQERDDLQEKIENLQQQWTRLTARLEHRISLARTYVQFHSLAVDLASDLDGLEEDLRRKDLGQDAAQHASRTLGEKWFSAQQLCLQLQHVGTNFMDDADRVMDPHLDVQRARLCIETLLDHFKGRQGAVGDQWDAWNQDVSVKRNLSQLWLQNMAECTKTLDWASKLQPHLYPILPAEAETCRDILRQLENKESHVLPQVKKAQSEIELRIKAAEVLALKGEPLPAENEDVIGKLMKLHEELQTILTDFQVLIQILQAFFNNVSQMEKTVDDTLHDNELRILPNNLQATEELMKQHEAHVQTVQNIFKFTKNESDTVKIKVSAIEPESVREADINIIDYFLTQFQSRFEVKSMEWRSKLEQHRRLCQFDADLQDISAALSQMSEQLLATRGQYGESVASAKATAQAFTAFEKTIKLIEQRMKAFIASGEELLKTGDSSAIRVEQDLRGTRERWTQLCELVRESRRLVDLSEQYFTLVEAAEEWFREGSRLLVTIARKSTAVKKPEEAEQLLQQVQMFLKPGEERQDERIKRISELAIELYGVNGSEVLSPVLSENQEMIDSFTLISEELNALATNLKTAESERENLKKEREEMDAGLSAVRAETLAAKAAAAAAEEAQRAAEAAAKALQDRAITTVSETVEIQESKSIQTQHYSSLAGKTEEQTPPRFVTPLSDATVEEGGRFTFECVVSGVPTPKISWRKESISVETNPDYQTKFDEEKGICSLAIEETFTEDSARYFCTATNISGTTETSGFLRVTETRAEESEVAPCFTAPLEDGEALEGGTWDLRCRVTGFPLPNVSWFKGETCVDHAPDYSITYNNGDATLRLERVYLEDQGLFSVRASNSAGSATCSAFLVVRPLEPTAAPAVVSPLQNIMVRPGQPIHLECEITGQPTPQISWQHDGRPIKPADAQTTSEGNKSILTVSEAFPAQAGTYTATARNLAGEVQTSCSVIVRGHQGNATSDSEQISDLDAVKPTVRVPLRSVIAVEGDEIRLDCVIMAEPEPEVIWYHNGEPVKESEECKLLFQGDRCSLLIQNTIPEDAGEYKVVAINTVGEASSTCSLSIDPKEEKKSEIMGHPPHFVTVLGDLIVDEGDTVVLAVCVRGDPEPDVRWYFNGQSVEITSKTQTDEDSDGNMTLTLRDVTGDVEGVYVVKASNTFGAVQSEANLTVTPKPKKIDSVPPKFKVELADRTVQEQDPVRLECVAVGFPRPVVTWLVNGAPARNSLVTEDGDRHVLTIPRVTRLDAGEVTCVAQNSAGTATTTATLTVNAAPVEQAIELVPFLEPIVSHSPMASSVTTRKQYVVESSSHTTKRIVTGAGEPQIQVHTFSSHDEQSSKQINQKPVEEKRSHETKEFHQVNDEAPQVKESSSLIVAKDGQVSQEVSKTSTSIPIAPKLTRKSTAPRFMTPLQGRIVDQGADVTLEGIIDGYPTPAVSWTKNGQEVVPIEGKLTVNFELNRMRLELKSADVTDGGRYSCKVSNSVGTATSTADVVVKKTVFPPVVGRRLQAQTAVIGERVILEAELVGNPEPTVTWYKDDLPIRSTPECRIKAQGDSHSLVIEKVGKEHEGQYMVKGTNVGGAATSTADLAVVANSSGISDYMPKPSYDIMIPVTHQSSQSNTQETVLRHDKSMSSQKMEKSSPQSSFSFNETTKTEKKVTVRMEKSPSPGLPIFKTLSNTQEISKPPEPIPSESSSQETASEDIDRSSITKRSALDFFMTKLKEGQEEERKSSETPKLKPIVFAPPVEEAQTPPAPELFSKQSELMSQFKRVHSVEEAPNETKPEEKVEKDAISLAKESYSIVQEEKSHQSLFSKTMYTELPKLTMPASPALDRNTATPLYLDSSFNLTPEPPPEVGFIPKVPEKVSKVTKVREDIAQKVKKLEEFHKVASPIDAPSGGVRLFPIASPKVEPKPEPKKPELLEKRQERPIETLPPLSWLIEDPPKPKETESVVSVKKEVQEEVIEKKTVRTGTDTTPRPFSIPTERVVALKSDPRPLSPKPSSEGLAMEKLWSQKRQEEAKTETSNLGVFRPPSAVDVRPASPRPSAEGLAMEKLWANRRDDSFTNLKVEETPKIATYQPPSHIDINRTASPKPSAEGISMERLWTQVKAPVRPATSLGVMDRSASPRPSQEGLAMDKIWAHKHRESTLKKSWPPPQQEDEKPIIPWAVATEEEKQNETVSKSTTTVVQDIQETCNKTESKHKIESNQKVIKSFTNTAPPPTMMTQKGPIQYYNAESRLIRQTQSMDRQIVKESSSFTKEITSQSSLSSLRKTWTSGSPAVDLQVSSSAQGVSQKSDLDLEPGPPPSIGFAPPPERRTSLVEAIEQDLKKEIRKEPSKQLPGAVRIIPPPPTTQAPKKKQARRTNSLESKPFEKFPDLEPFPFKADPPKPKTSRCPPPPTPTKFKKGNFTESDYESDYESRMSVKWKPYDSEGEELRFRPVRPPSVVHPKRPQSTEPEPLPPSKFEKPAQLEGPRPAPKQLTTFSKTTKISADTKKEILQHFSSPVKPAKPQAAKKPASPPKLKPGSPPQFLQASRTSESGYMADTEDISLKRQSKSTVIRSSHTTQKSTYQEDLKSPKIVQQLKAPPSPTRFLQSESRCSEYESDIETRVTRWATGEPPIKSVRPVFTPTIKAAQTVGATPPPPSQFEVPPPSEGPFRPKFEPIAPAPTSSRQNVKRDEVRKTSTSQTLFKPKPLTPKQVPTDFNLKPGSPPEIVFAPAFPKAVETSNMMSFKESTETSQRTVNLQQTTRVISFGKERTKTSRGPPVTKFPARMNAESDYESDMEGIRFPPEGRVAPPQPRCTSAPLTARQPSSFAMMRPSLQRNSELNLTPGEPPEFGFAPVQTATSYANRYMQDMSQSFKSKAQQFMTDVMADSKKPDKPILKQVKQGGKQNDPQTYRDESRLSEFGTKCIDPDTGLIYFKYDFGYEVGILLPGEGKKFMKGSASSTLPRKIQRRESIDFPIIHEKGSSSTLPRTNKPNPHKTVKWESESEWSDGDDALHKKRLSLPGRAAPHIWIPGARGEVTPSPSSLSPSLSSWSPRQGLQGVKPSPGTPEPTAGFLQRNVSNLSNEPPKAPTFITPLRDIAVVSGQPARFECIIQAEPTPNVLWSKDGRIVETDEAHDVYYKNGVCRLTIAKAYPFEAGTYTCTATNLVGSAGSSATLLVPGERRGLRNSAYL